MRVLFTITKLICFILLGLVLLIFAVFYRPDLSLEHLELTYFTEDSHYYTATITSLEDDMIDIDIHYIDMGSTQDEVIVLLHGAFASSHTFIPWANALVNLGYRIIMIDLPYHGLSAGFDDHIQSTRRSAAVVKNLLDHLDITSLYIGGNSMGGGVSWVFTGLYHSDVLTVKGLILIDAVYPSSQSGRPDRFRILSRPVIRSIASQMTPKFLLKYILQGVYGSASELNTETVTRYYDLLRREGNRLAILRNTQEITDLDTQLLLLDRIKDEGVPVLVIWGQEDTWIPVSVADLFKERLNIPDENIVLLEGIGHVPMEEDPEGTIVHLMTFLNP
jgi:pimeloyl-ACP methyl ester carboxylesterase